MGGALEGGREEDKLVGHLSFLKVRPGGPSGLLRRALLMAKGAQQESLGNAFRFPLVGGVTCGQGWGGVGLMPLRVAGERLREGWPMVA